ncbi:uncharacterized protein [Argopecten irradians]|uniref:uncharacterized protein n=1 Tax=Argopecten irradians TaxID=31199 RepID=UPI003711A8B7
MNNTLNNSTQEGEHLLLSTKEKFLLSTMCAVAVFAFAEHSVILIVATISKTLRRKPFVVSILLLSLSDLLLSLGLFLYSCINLASLRQIWICGLSFFLLHLGLVLSLVHTLSICTERYLCTRTIQIETFSVRKRQALAVISTGICSLILGIPYLFTVRSATVLPCKAKTLFEENRSYALAPARCIIFLVWICTVIIYALTAKNFRRSLRRTNRLRRGHSKRNNRFRAAQMNHGNTSLSCSSTGQIKTGTKSVKTITLGRNSKEHLGDIHAVTNVPDDITVKNNGRAGGAFLSELERTVQTGESSVGRNIRFVVSGGKSRDNITGIDKIGEHSVEHSTTRPELLPIKFIDAESSSRSVGLGRQIKSRPSPPLPELKAFRIVSVVFIVFIVTMTPQSVAGVAMIVFPFSQTVDWFCNALAVSSILTNPLMHAFLLEDFRKILRCK